MTLLGVLDLLDRLPPVAHARSRSVKPDVVYFGYLPGYSGSGPTTTGNKGVLFSRVAARYVRLEADAVNGTGGAQATEVVAGARR